MRNATKLLAFVLAFVMVLGMVPMASAQTVHTHGIEEYPEIFANEEVLVSIGEPGLTVYMRFTPTVTAEYTFASHDTDWRDPQGYLYDAEMNLLAKHEDNGFNPILGYNDLNFTLVYTMEAGTTYILAVNLYNVNYISEFLVSLTADLPSEHNYVGEVTTGELPFVNPFTDVNEDDWFYDSVVWAVKGGITNGATETTFGPNGELQRAQAVTFLYRALAD